MMKKIMGYLLAIIVFILIIPGVTALAQPDLNVKVSAGIDGKAKYEKGAPISITVENTGTHFSGDLVIDVMESYNQGMGRAFPLEIGTGETKTISFIVNNLDGMSGMYGNQNFKSIYFYEGGWKKGKEIKHSGAQAPTATMYHEERMIVTFTNNIDRLVSLKSVDIGPVSNVLVIDSEEIDVMSFPDDARGWAMIEYIVLDEYAFADLQSEKQLALLEWVKNGGIIIIGSSDNLENEVGVFAPYLPLKLTEQIEIIPTVLNEWANTKGFEETIRAYSSELNEGAFTLLREENHLLVAEKKLGSGLVIQTAFSLGDDPIAKSPGMTAVWNKLFSAGENVINSPFKNMYDPVNQLSYTVGQTNELFPSFKVSAPLIFGIITLYIIIIIPILYFILKRKDKREYAWWIIPAIALLTSVAIFGYGAKDRIGRAQIQHTAILNVEPDGNVKGYFAESILSNKSGDYTFKAPHGTTLAASPQNTMFNTNGNMIHKKALLENDAAGTALHFRSVGYWNVASVYGETNLKDVGGIVNDLMVEKGLLTGSITNEFPFELKDVAIWSGSDFIPLDNIGAGDTVEIKETLKTALLSPRLPYQGMYTSAVNDDLMKIRKNNALSFFSDNMSASNKPVLIGYTDTQVVPVTLENVNTSLSSLTLIVQPIKSDFILQGKINADESMLEMYMAVSEPGYGNYIIDNPIQETYTEGIEYTQSWRLPEELVTAEIDWETMKLYNLDHQLYSSQILNIRTGEFELVESDELTLTENMSDYIAEDGIVTIHINFNNGKYSTGKVLPKLELIGEVSK
jgi:hypothetical protein